MEQTDVAIGARVRYWPSGPLSGVTGIITQVSFASDGAIKFRVMKSDGNWLGNNDGWFYIPTSFELLYGPEDTTEGPEPQTLREGSQALNEEKPCPLMYYGTGACTCGKCGLKRKVRLS